MTDKHPVAIVRVPHGGFRGGVRHLTVAPTLTTADWQNNNHIVEMQEAVLMKQP